MKCKLLIILTILLVNMSVNAVAATWYAAPAGTGSGSSAGDPTSLSTAISSAVSGDTVRLSAGTFSPSSTLTLSTDISIIGRGMVSSVIDCSSASTCFSMNYSGSETTMTKFSIQNASSSGVYVFDSTLEIASVMFSSNGTAVRVNGSAAASNIRNSVFDGNSTAFSEINGVSESIRNSIISNQAMYGLYINSTNTGLVVKNNTFENNKYAIEIQTPTSGSNGIQILKNTISGSTTNSIHLTGASSYAAQHVIRGNTIENATTIGIHSLLDIDETIIDGNTIDSMTKGGIALYGTGETIVTNNLITNSSSYGIGIWGSSATIAYNTVANNSGVGIATDEYSGTVDDSKIVNNISYQNGSYGITSNYASNTTQIGNNNAYDNTTNYYGSYYTDLGGNLEADPLFLGSGDYHLDASSTMIDAADVSMYSVAYDLELTSRLPTSCNLGPDIGAFEYH
jgi:parallel beta-helix repeat protein